MKEVLKGMGLRHRIQDRIILLEKACRRVSCEVQGDQGAGRMMEIHYRVTVMIKGTAPGYQPTEWNFTLNMPEEYHVLLFLLSGWRPEVKLTGTETINVVLKMSGTTGEVIVSTGYSQTIKRERPVRWPVGKEVFENKGSYR